MFERLSIARKLPLLLGGLLLAVSLVLSAGLYRETRRAALDAAAARLAAASRDLAGLFGAGVPRLLADARALGRLPEVRALVRSGAGAAAAPPSLNRLLAGPRPLFAIEVWDTVFARRMVLGATVAPLPDSSVRHLARMARADTGAAVGSFRVIGDSTYYPVIGVVGDSGEAIGYLVLWLRGASTPQAAQQISQLAGERARILVGATSAWSDLRAPIPGPPPGQLARGGLMEYERSGVGRVLAAAAAVPRTPWQIVVEFPRPQILAGPRRFLIRAMVLVLLVSLIGVGAVWMISRSATRPFIAVTHAAETIAAGQYAARAPIEPGRGDEAGRLAAAFNAMAAQVERAEQALRSLNAELERRVAQRTIELQDANRELEAFSYSVSHDLRAPLRAIDGFSRILVDEHAAKLGAEGVRLGRVIRTNTARMAALIDDLLALSQLGRQVLATRPVDLAALVREVVDEVRGSEPDRAVTVEIGELGSRPGDRALLRHVYQNLIQNAFKFTRQAATPRITIGVEQTDAGPVFFVRDNGAGFDPRYADKLFGVFQRLHRAEEFEGTGVGLAIVQRIVHRHGGRVWAEGAPGRGATFQFTLPAEARE